jgi:murein DD-endopeptidase MepM/ murein hydrolase activator NlpD
MISYRFLLILFVTTNVLAQNPRYENTLKEFQLFYNQQNPTAIFEMFDASMQETVPLATVEELVTSFSQQLGMLQSFTFSQHKDVTDVYIAHFEKGDLNLSITANEKGNITGLLFKPIQNDNAPGLMERTVSSLQFPAEGTWFTVWGGTTREQNYHIAYRSQRGAFDFLILGSQNKTYRGHGTKNEDYYAFGQPLYAVCDAEVFRITTGVEDNRPGVMNAEQMLGNSVTLKTEHDEYIVYAHFQKGTLAVREGDRVTKGMYLGNCGNSGNSSEPHLHLHVQDGPDMMSATGIRAYFEELVVNGSLKTDYSPVRLDRVSRPEQ